MKHNVEIHSEFWGKEVKSPENIFIFLHGMGGQGSLWRPHAASLENKNWIFAPDQRGHGKSKLPSHLKINSSDFTPEKYGGDILQWILQSPISKSQSPIWVIGHSMGVRTACALANLCNDSDKKTGHPADYFPKISGLILVDLGFSGQAGGGLGETLGTFLKKLPKRFNSRAEAREFMTIHCPDTSIGQYLMAVSTLQSDGAIEFPFDHASLIATIEAAQNSNIRSWMVEFSQDIPILALRGETSKVWTEKEYEEEKQFFQKHAECKIIFQTLTGTGHGLPFEKRQEFLSIIELFIRGIIKKAGTY